MSDHEYAYNDFDENPDPPHQPLYLDKVVSYLSKAGSRTVLDAGCGDGNFTQSVAEREPGVASVSAPIRDRTGRVIASISISGPIERLGRRPGERHAMAVVRAGQRLSGL
jgi:hypothetical protein